jgi:DNA repair photolyase
VADDLEYFAQFKGRDMLGLSLTAPVCKENVAKVLEPQASSISERIEVYRKAKKLGLRVYGMLCPLLPGVASSHADIRDLMETMLEFDPEDIWLEPVNPRGNGIVKCAEALKDAGFKEEFYRVDAIRETEIHQLYVDDLVDDATQADRDLECLSKLKILVYGEEKNFCCDTSAVIWL